MTPEQHAQAIEDAAIAYAEARHTQGSDLYNGTTYSARQVLKSAIRAGVGAAPATPENIREGERLQSLFCGCQLPLRLIVELANVTRQHALVEGVIFESAIELFAVLPGNTERVL